MGIELLRDSSNNVEHFNTIRVVKIKIILLMINVRVNSNLPDIKKLKNPVFIFNNLVYLVFFQIKNKEKGIKSIINKERDGIG